MNPWFSDIEELTKEQGINLMPFVQDQSSILGVAIFKATQYVRGYGDLIKGVYYAQHGYPDCSMRNAIFKLYMMHHARHKKIPIYWKPKENNK